ncbi:Cpg1 family polymorphic protein [Ehrlichia japonica]|uniref:Uncharacterized protein n=1 Tax=Ehrlichia japonica TaxID=391036 RepID=X5H1I6_9RICK|nr:hypothetical protein [Ehrlichia japonica]AHX04709.1 hypothetical protein EHF_0745 [Ehrlichia japonica]
MPGKPELSNNQLKLYNRVQQHINNNQVVKSISFTSKPLSYISYRINSLFFGSKNTAHENCTIVTEEFTCDLILASADFEDFIQVTACLNEDLKEQCNADGILFLYALLPRLTKHISNKLAAGGILSHNASTIENILSTATEGLENSFNPTDITCYEEFIDSILNPSNQDILLKEAQQVLQTVQVLTFHALLIRGIAHAIVNKVIPDQEHKAQVEIEAKTSTLLHVTALTHTTRESTTRNLNNDFARQHPYQNKFLSLASYFNKHVSSIISYAYISSILSVFITRVYSGYASDRAERDVQAAMSALGYNITFNHTRDYRPDINYHNAHNSTVIYAPRHPSEYFPEHEGIINGFPVYMTTIMSTIQLFLTLPNMILSQSKRRFMLKTLNKYSPTPAEQRNSTTLTSVLIFRWVGNVIGQPVDCVDSPYKDLFFKWTIFRLFTPSAPLEEPLKIQNIYNCLNRNCYRNRGSHVQINNTLTYSSVMLTAALEYLDAAFGFPYLPLSAALKGTRLASVVIPVLANRHNICYNSRFKKFVFANMLRTASSPIILTAFDQLGSTIRYVSLLTALDVVVTVNADAVSSSILSEAGIIEQQLVIIEDIMQNAMQNNTASLALLSPTIERRLQQLRSTLTISEILERDEEQGQDSENQEGATSDIGCIDASALPSPSRKQQCSITMAEEVLTDIALEVQSRSYSRRNMPEFSIIEIDDEEDGVNNSLLPSSTLNVSSVSRSSSSMSRQ